MIKTREQILNEAFIGKKPTDKLFGHWKDLVEFIVNNPHTPHQREKCYEEFRKELCNVFGFSETALIIIPYKEVNAMTYPARFDDTDLTQLKDIFIVNNKIIKLNPKYKNKTVFYFYSEILRMMSVEESFAVLLHEIGHSFNNVLLQAYYMSTRSNIQKMIDNVKSAFNSILNKMSEKVKNVIGTKNIYGDGTGIWNNDMTEIIDYFDNMIKDDKEFQKYKQWYATIHEREKDKDATKVDFGMFGTIMTLLLSPIILPIGLIQYMTNGNLNSQAEDRSKQIKSQWSQYMLNLENEYNADNFASIYGYGSELASGLSKFDDIYRNLKSNNSLETKVLRCIVLLNRMTVDTHPNEYARLTTLMKHAEYELKNNKSINKDQKKELEKMLAGCKESLEKLYETNRDVSKSPLSVRIYNRMNEKARARYESDASKRDFDRGYREIQNAQVSKINESTGLSVLNEKFIGPKPLEKLHDYWTVLYNKVKVDDISTFANDDPDYQNFKKEMCEVFGFGEMNLELAPAAIINAFTLLPSFTGASMEKKLDIFLVTDKSIKINPKYNVYGYFVVYKEMFRQLECDELFAVFLHEVGHNFNYLMVQVKAEIMKTQSRGLILLVDQLHTKVSALVQKVFGHSIDGVSPGDLISTVKNKIYNVVSTWGIKKGLDKIVDVISHFFNDDVGDDKKFGLLNSLQWIIQTPLIFGMQASQQIKLAIGALIRPFLVQSNDENKYIKAFDIETQADNFPAIFGYGSAAASGLAKMSKIIWKVNAGSGIAEGCYRLILLITHATATCHPDTIQRLVNLKKHAEYELKNNKSISNKEKAILEKSIKDCNDLLEDLMGLVDSIGRDKPLTYRIWMSVQKKYLQEYERSADERDFEFGYDYLEKEQQGLKEFMIRENINTLQDLYYNYK